MSDITPLMATMKAAAERATPGPWGIARDGKTVVSNQSHPVATISDAMHRVLADGAAGQDAEFIALANPAHIKALVEALEAKQPHHNGLMQLSNELVMAKQRIAELESRTVTVKLPERYSCELGYPSPDPDGELLDRNDVIDVLRAAGIQVIEGDNYD